MKTKTIIILSLVIVLTMACSSTSITGESPSGEQPGRASATPDPVPVTINDGLNSLDSYEMTVSFHSTGPDPATSSTTTILRQRSLADNASFTSITTSSSSPEEGAAEPGESLIYQIGNEQCSGNDAEGWSWSSSTPLEGEMQGLVTGMLGLTPLIDDPVFVAVETIHGIPSNHFSFQVSGLGTSSGAVVNLNQGDYWLAIDGQYIVKYVLVVEMSMAADSEVMREEITIEMNQVNQPVSIAFPQACLDASLVP